MNHISNYKMFNENIREGGEISNQKYGPMVCVECGYRGDGFKFQRLFFNKLKCPKCKSSDIRSVERSSEVK